MHPYLERTSYAAEILVNAIFREEKELSSLTNELAQAKSEAMGLSGSIDPFIKNNDLDDEGLGQLMYFEAWEANNSVDRITRRAEAVSQSVVDKSEAVIALCGALLQIAKRGITGADTKLKVRQPGRWIDGLRIEEIIWGARNQSMHHEAVPTNSLTKRVFDTLESKYGSRFDAKNGKDLAREVVALLSWTSMLNYTLDMESILP